MTVLSIMWSITTTSAQQYRLKAAECDQRAREARDPTVKKMFEEMAREWLVMADQAERHGW